MAKTSVAENRRSITEQGHRLLEQHEELGRRLTKLRRVAALQLAANSVRAWDTVLAQKQSLLAQIEALDLEKLFVTTTAVLPELPEDFNGEGPEQLRLRQVENIALMREVLQIEAQAEAHLKNQIDQLHNLLGQSQRTAKVNAAYHSRRKAQPPPRFLDSRR